MYLRTIRNHHHSFLSLNLQSDADGLLGGCACNIFVADQIYSGDASRGSARALMCRWCCRKITYYWAAAFCLDSWPWQILCFTYKGTLCAVRTRCVWLRRRDQRFRPTCHIISWSFHLIERFREYRMVFSILPSSIRHTETWLSFLCGPH